MKLTQIAVALAAVTTLSAGAARADVMPFNAVLDAPNVAGSASPASFVPDDSAVAPQATTVAFPLAGADDEENKSKKATYLLIPAGLGAAFLSQAAFGGGGSGAGQRAFAPDPFPIGLPNVQPSDPQVAPVPELSSSLLVLTGCALLMLTYRRRLGSNLLG